MSETQEHYMKGLGLYGEGRHAEAVSAFQKALELEPDRADCLQALSMAQMHAGRLDDALANVIKLTELTPDDPQAFTSLSMVYQRKDRIDDAEKAQAKARMLSWREELKTNPNASPPADADGMNVVQ